MRIPSAEVAIVDIDLTQLDFKSSRTFMVA